MVNVYGLLERLTNYPQADVAIKSILEKHHTIEVSDLLDLIPIEHITTYLERKKYR